jgi:hypothetical protein
LNGHLGSSRETGGRDALDVQVGRIPEPAPGRWRQLLQKRAALGLGPMAAPAVVFVPVGVVLGPRVLDVLSQDVLAHLDAGVSVALATLGVFVGLALDLRPRDDRRLFLAACVEASTTIVVVGVAIGVLLVSWGLPLQAGVAPVAITLALCAAASSAGASEAWHDPVHRSATRVADLDDVVPILLAGMLLAGVGGATASTAMLRLGLTIAIGVSVGLAGWLLFERAESDAERGVFVVGAVLLLGGLTAYKALSPLLAGLIAGLFWTYSKGRADQIIWTDLTKVQHPFVALLLIVAGATIEMTNAALWLFVPFIVFRIAGKLAGGWLGSRLAGDVAPADLGAYLLPPGVLGIAFALNAHQIWPTPTGVAIVSAVAAGSLVSEVIAAVAHPGHEEA